jgi:hypothetical protein
MGKYSINILNTVISIGQSNDCGAGTVAESTYPTTNSNIFTYWKSDNTTTDNGVWQTINWGTNTTNSDTLVPTSDIGYQCALTELLRTYLGTDIYLIKAGRGSTAIYDAIGSLNFNIAEEGVTVSSKPQLIDLFTKYYFPLAMSRMASKGITKVKAITWFQGENDMLNGTVSAPYQVNEINMFNKIRLQPNLYGVKVVSIAPNPYSATYTNKSVVQTAKATNASNNPTWFTALDITSIVIGNYQGDQIHLKTVGYEDVGTRVYNLIKDN